VLGGQRELPDEVVSLLRAGQAARLQYIDYSSSDSGARRRLVVLYDEVELQLQAAERDLINDLYRCGKLKDEPRRRIERDLDLRDAYLANLRADDEQ
jgi:CPA1 family monovalent cation:H+ antiporter